MLTGLSIRSAHAIGDGGGDVINKQIVAVAPVGVVLSQLLFHSLFS